ncbi:MAG TPA: ATP-dependent RNA helicase HrpA [Syntrophales bacterium]|nr:ATP-dependent RNA helicase HrpA [Syntrophales bacterium]
MHERQDRPVRTGGLARGAFPLERLNYPAGLPIVASRTEIVRALRTHRVVVIAGETGSGKTTQIPKMCLEAGRGVAGLIGCTQPRRIAAVTVAQRLAEELNEPLGRSVGYKIRFEECRGPGQRIKFMTDGVLLAETQSDRLLRRYDTLIVDEAHERSLNIDFVLGIVKTLLERRRDLHLVITSATIDTEKFSLAFDRAPVIEVTGRTYPVEVLYQPPEPGPSEADEETHVEAAVAAAVNITARHPDGDVLIFMPTEPDIRETCDLLEGRNMGTWAVLPLYARLPASEQRRVFQPARASRKIIVATNVAETSLTIPNIRFVIDTGLARIGQYNPRTRTTSLPVRSISRSSANQRLGRCGRLRNGVCVRLYSEEDYLKRAPFTAPEILRANLAAVILNMMALNLGGIQQFPFIDKPSPKRIRDGIELLLELGALEPAVRTGREDTAREPYRLTPRGRSMARLPLDPRLSRMIIEAEREGCLDEMLVIAAALSIQDPRERPPDKAAQADQAHRAFADPLSDFASLLTLWTHCRKQVGLTGSQGALKRYCREQFLSYRRMREWKAVRDELATLASEAGVGAKAPPPPGGGATPASKKTRVEDPYARIHRAILSGHLSNIAVKKEKNVYTAAHGREAFLFPGSGLYNRGPRWIVAAEMVETSRLFARTCAQIDPAWIESLAGPLCRTSCSGPHWDPARGEVVADARVTLFGLVIVPARPVSFGPLFPEEAFQIFLREVLVEGRVRPCPPFLRHNLSLRERVGVLEDKVRRHDILVDDDDLVRFYRTRLPVLWSMRSLMKVVRERGSDAFLRLSEEDLWRRPPDEEIPRLYPDETRVASDRFRLVYRYAPEAPDDGVTLRVPAEALPDLRAAEIERGCPGLWQEKILALLKGLPKEARKRLSPLTESAGIICSEMDREYEHLPSALSGFVTQRFGLDVPAAVWSAIPLPEHLHMRVAVWDDDHGEVVAGRDLARLQREQRREVCASSALERLRAEWETPPATDWAFPDLPERIPLLERGRIRGYAYPALEAAGDGCRPRLCTDPGEAEGVHHAGVMRLACLCLPGELKSLKKAVALSVPMKARAALCGGPAAWERRILEKVLGDLVDVRVRRREDFQDMLAGLRARLMPHALDITALVSPVLKAASDASRNLSALEKAHRFNRPALAFLAALKGELARLIPDDFLQATPADRIAHLPRYLAALSIRAQRGLDHLDRALAREAPLRAYAKRLSEFTAEITPHTTADKRREIEDLFWMIEEYKVSVFAQELKTPAPVSPKRLQAKIAAIEALP